MWACVHKKKWSSLEQCRRSRTHRRNQSLPSVRHHVFKSQKYCASLTVFVIKKSSSLHRHQNYRLRSVDSRIYIPLGGGLRSSPVICYHRALSSSVVASIHRRATNRPGCDKLVASMSAALKICTLSAFYAIPRPPTQSTRSINHVYFAALVRYPARLRHSPHRPEKGLGSARLLRFQY